ncbi:NAD(P)H-dependent oxidoreductase [Kutzneria viridogrisea]|uniref:FMN dependent NADH:quinone oxidoreductase n=2 Tax=Kutzneria TaxID=43356 RepID=W5WJ20_9PSEU|nr:hypothetical protein KALB_7515 [Kutzneria albida DSM 43870]MBA8926150.1 FMN-dependent NADH-azoreductase [Kutzneria viridogrisea]
MPSLLHLDSSANRSGESVSRQLTALFADTWRARHGSAGYRYRDLAADPVPPLGTAYCVLGRRLERHGLVPADQVATLVETPEEDREWALTRPLVAELLAADTLLIGAPMYNLSVPATLKAWLDRVTFPLADSLFRGTRVVVVTARGGTGSPDFHTPYLRAYFGKQGVAEQDLFLLGAELTIAELLPHLADLRPRAANSLAAARAEVAALLP